MSPSSFPSARETGHEKWIVFVTSAVFVAILALRLPEIFAGFVPGADDLMRLQQVRDLLAGQSWFLVDQSRMLTPESGDMHWSRLPDLFLAAVILLTEPFIGRVAAEHLAIGLWPLVLLSLALYFLNSVLLGLRIGVYGRVFAIIFFATSAAIYNFWPARIDHHGLNVTLALGGLAAALAPRMSAQSGISLALAITAMLSVALESLPYVVGLIALIGLFWIVRGHLEGVRLAAFGLALAIFASGFYLLDAPGLGAGRYVCDAYGTSHWAALCVGGLFFTLLGMFGGALDTWQKRLGSGTAAGLVTLAVFVAINPNCLGDPYATVPDSVRLAWLDVVTEAKTLPTLIEQEPDRIVWVFGFLLASAVATAIMIARAPDSARLARVGFALVFGLSILATVWQIRGQSFSHVFAAVGAGWLVGWLFSRWREQTGVGPLLAFIVAAVAVSPLTWRNISTRFAKPLPYEDAGMMYNASCTSFGAYAELRTEPGMRIHAPIILGPWIIARTPQSVFTAPYHRNIAGIETVTDIYIGSSDAAHSALQSLGATHLLYCRGLNETNRYGLIWPESFAAQLNRDEIPAWLEPADTRTEYAGTVRLYRILEDGSSE